MDFDIHSVKKIKIELLSCQVDLVLRSLEFYAYTYKFIYPRGGIMSKEENLRICLVRDTYEQIVSEVGVSVLKNRVGSKVFEDDEKIFKKMA